MKKRCLLVFFAIFLTHISYGCPCQFSADDSRPFFEQYELKNNIKTQEKEKTNEKNNATNTNTDDSSTLCK